VAGGQDFSSGFVDGVQLPSQADGADASCCGCDVVEPLLVTLSPAPVRRSSPRSRGGVQADPGSVASSMVAVVMISGWVLSDLGELGGAITRADGNRWPK